ncbi:DUF4190 domain-containing protein [Flavobacterium sp. NST-5]|uniref:DUF4190 domain-containing protein n=1 Tax=Flavobacterium ichthyis TaxID=2698827 RepID=A0ABW9Z8V2_9FLAO|nr:CCC motif membrane protein [Flavobacterium ichthyis]NBL65146.1 DUF4190 domain-containing protein [Flavobacterium ichthyis]
MENYQFETRQPSGFPTRRPLPNATTVLVLGIVSIPTSFCYGIIGVILGIICLVLAKKDRLLYESNPEMYSGIENVNSGRVCGIIGLCLGSLFLIFVILYLVFVVSIIGAAAAAS